MTITANEWKHLQREVEALKKKVAQLERRSNGKRRTPARKKRIDKIRQAARRNAMTETEAMSLALKAQETPSDQRANRP